jgi:hypothetical protein
LTAAIPCRIFIEVKEEAGLGRILVKALPYTQNADFIVFCPFEAVNGRFASATPRPKQAAFVL